ncbi:MAG TPA: hypothetical protein VJY15_07305 [Candidatus Acidoferrum sp.]|nr:hypothetical protein [Candidatus Acidoferrum sp.]
MALTKQQKQLVLLAALMLIAALVWYVYFGRKQSAPEGAAFRADSYTPINAQDFSIIFKQRGNAQKTEYRPSGRNPFVVSALPVVAAVTAPKSAEKPRWPDYTVPREVIVPPQLPWKFFGFGNLPSSGVREAFLLEGEDVHIVGEGEVVLNHIRIVHIGNEKIEYEDTNTGARNSNQLEAVPGPSA